MTYKSLIMENTADVGVAGMDLKSQRARAIFDAEMAVSRKTSKVEYEYTAPKSLELSSNGDITGRGTVTAIVKYITTSVITNITKTALFKVTYPYVIRANAVTGRVGSRIVDNGVDVEATCDDIMIKLDKKTSTAISTRLIKLMNTSTLSKTFDILSSHEYRTLKAKYEDDVETQRIERKTAALIKKNSELAGLSNKYGVPVSRIAKGYREAVVIYDADIDEDDREKIESLIGSYDTEVWAIERGYQSAVDDNDEILKKLGTYGRGVVYYTTGPNRTDMKIKI